VKTEPSAHPAEDPQHAVASIRTELARVRASVERIERGLSDLEASEPTTGRGRRRPERYLRVLVDIYELGGRHGVSGEEWTAIGNRHGYDRRGLGGFFTGARAPLHQVDSRIALTVQGERLVDQYLATLAT
jgi:hypothetical protein